MLACRSADDAATSASVLQFALDQRRLVLAAGEHVAIALDQALLALDRFFERADVGGQRRTP